MKSNRYRVFLKILTLSKLGLLVIKLKHFPLEILKRLWTSLINWPRYLIKLIDKSKKYFAIRELTMGFLRKAPL